MIKNSLILAFIALLLFSCKPSQHEAISKIESSLMPSIQIEGKEEKHHILERMEHYKVPGVSIAVVKDGKLAWAKGYGMANTESGKEVDENTLFQAGSISKPLAALAALKLVDEQSAELDADVNQYLVDWKIDENGFTAKEKVTLRRLLNHTAGMTVHGFPGYKQTEDYPSIDQVLNGEGNTKKVFVDQVPGTAWRYSGGGYTVMEKVVEDISGLPLEDYMEKNILKPLKMKNSTYLQPLPPSYHKSNISAAYNRNGDIVEGLYHNYPEQAAAGLWTTPTDLAKYCLAVQEIVSGKSNGVLSNEIITEMITKGENGWGLGPGMEGEGEMLLFKHGGKNEGFTNDMIAFVHKGDAVIVMTNADNGGALIKEILHAVSDHYEWDIRKPQSLKPLALDSSELQQFSGKFKYDGQIPELGAYIVEVKSDGDQLVIMDPNPPKALDLKLIPLEKLKFVDLGKGDEIIFAKNGEGIITSFQGPGYRFNRLASDQ